MRTETRDDVLRAYSDVIGMTNEHDDYDGLTEKLGLDVAEFHKALATIAAAIERDFTAAQTPWWPPLTGLDRACGLQGAYRLGILTALQMVRDA